jgi:hypothetical protein
VINITEEILFIFKQNSFLGGVDVVYLSSVETNEDYFHGFHNEVLNHCCEYCMRLMYVLNIWLYQQQSLFVNSVTEVFL